MIHELKCWPEPFQAMLDGRKPFEIRRADRPFAVGDELRQREWKPCSGNPCQCDGSGLGGDYTGRELTVQVTYVAPGGSWGLPADLCVMGIEPADGATATRAELTAELVRRDQAIQAARDEPQRVIAQRNRITSAGREMNQRNQEEIWRLEKDIVQARTDVERMRPVVEAAERWRDLLGDLGLAPASAAAVAAAVCALAEAVDVYHAAAPAQRPADDYPILDAAGEI